MTKVETIIKRIFDVGFSVSVLSVISPALAGIAVVIKLTDPGPVFFQQTRVGRHGQHFKLLKFRTMKVNAEALGKITVDKDPRITPFGAVLRKTKLDELPQFFNVLIGHMSVVGPRPEVPEYVAFWPEQDAEIILTVKPGITDATALKFSNESELLFNVDDPSTYYIDEILPKKVAGYVEYVQSSNLLSDLKLINATAIRMVKG